jgi:hypothetical protein
VELTPNSASLQLSANGVDGERQSHNHHQRNQPPPVLAHDILGFQQSLTVPAHRQDGTKTAVTAKVC